MRLVVLLGMVPSVVILGYIADHVGAHVAMAICAFGYVIIAVIGASMPSVRNETR
ncbi:MAG: hypothetical protein JO193_04190 [Candidatus Eremiobacteraeota bacterium]|nr:hypothetical protein [Candidatus Eremiobacteraeota bacterium]MBV9972094.1 hypothetical protein [Candidatus Eremiobacteraeota bacterium]